MAKSIFFPILIVFVFTLICGCETRPTQQGFQKSGSAEVMSAGFSDEQYVWESFMFPTNRTSGVQ